MDTLYYSNHCKHSQGVIQFLVKSNLAEKMNFLCIDRRKRDGPAVQIILSNGKTVPMPPHVHSVPALVTGKGYNVVYGEDIVRHFSATTAVAAAAVEPLGQPLASPYSEPFTFYNLTSEELSAKGAGGRRQLYNYVSANDTGCSSIPTPAETYRPDKVAKDVTVESLSSQREVFVPKV
jgi:hypothetical protein